jgi:hypothetical protein
MHDGLNSEACKRSENELGGIYIEYILSGLLVIKIECMHANCQHAWVLHRIFGMVHAYRALVLC